MNKNITSQKQKTLRTIIIIGVALVLGMVVFLWLTGAFNTRVVCGVYLQTEDALKKISPGTDEGLFTTPNINPTGDAAVFHGAVSGYSRIWKYTLENDAIRALTDDDYVAVEPSYSWDGTQIAFAADKGTDQERTDMSKISNNPLLMGQMYLGGSPKILNIHIMNADGSDMRQLTMWDAVDMRPTFSPDGEHILFMSTHESGSLKELHLHTVSVAGDEEPKLIPNSEGAHRPWYSVDGAWIYYWKEIDGRGTLCRIAADGSEWYPLASGLDSHGPFVDLSGEWIWFHSVSDTYQIFRMPIDGGDPISVTPPGFEKEEHVGHVTAAMNGNYTFDVLRFLQKN